MSLLFFPCLSSMFGPGSVAPSCESVRRRRIFARVCACVCIFMYLCACVASHSFKTGRPDDPYCKGQIYLGSANLSLLTPNICWGQAASSGMAHHQLDASVHVPANYWQETKVCVCACARVCVCVCIWLQLSESLISFQISSCLGQTCSKDCGYTTFCIDQSVTYVFFFLIYAWRFCVDNLL